MVEQALQVELSGEVLAPGDAGYPDAARTFLAQGAPVLVVRPADEAEVAAAIRYAVQRELPLSVRSGGHGATGHATNTGGLVIDLARLDGVEVLDAGRRTVRVGGGATWGRVADALAPYGWGITAGDTRSVGVGGLTLGGGVGWMVRKHGLAIDSLVGARVVTAEGRVLDVNDREHADLFWALRGGGGNFGVVTSFDFLAQDERTVHYGALTYAVDGSGDLVTRWRDAMRRAPDELSSTLVLAPRMGPAPETAVVLACYGGADAAAADGALEPLLGLGRLVEGSIAQLPYSEILEEPHHPPGVRLVARNTLVRRLDGAVIRTILAARRAGPPAAYAIRALGGAFARVPQDATAFAHRDAEALIVSGTFVPPDAAEADVESALAGWRSVADLGSGVYTNFQGSATPADLASAYPPRTLARLSDVKRDYDPDNVFALNHNILPA